MSIPKRFKNPDWDWLMALKKEMGREEYQKLSSAELLALYNEVTVEEIEARMDFEKECMDADDE